MAGWEGDRPPPIHYRRPILPDRQDSGMALNGNGKYAIPEVRGAGDVTIEKEETQGWQRPLVSSRHQAYARSTPEEKTESAPYPPRLRQGGRRGVAPADRWQGRHQNAASQTTLRPT